MNIKDLPQGSYTVEQPQTLNIRDLPKDSFTFDQSMGTLAHSQASVDQMRVDQQQAELAAQQAQSSAGIAQETGRGTMGAIADTALKFARSAIHAPVDIVQGFMGKSADTSTTTGFSGEPQQTIQGEVESGKTGLLGAAEETAFGALDVLGMKGLGSGITKGIGALAEKTGLRNIFAKRAEKRLLQDTAKALTPKLTTGEIREAGAAGKAGKTFFGTPKIDYSKDKQFMKVADSVKGMIKGKSAIDDTNNVRKSLIDEAEALKSRVKANDTSYSLEDLAKRLNNAKEPISLRGTPFEKQIKPIKQAAIQIAQKQKGGNMVSSLLDARKEFDQLVDRTYPNLYESENAPMRNAITAIRKEMNKFIGENLPKETGFQESLDKQTLYYDAIDNLSTKIPDELKAGGKLKRFMKKPVVQLGTAAIIGAGGSEAANKLVGK